MVLFQQKKTAFVKKQKIQTLFLNLTFYNPKTSIGLHDPLLRHQKSQDDIPQNVGAATDVHTAVLSR